jgi:V8-like Glu-specific endopeptidase
VKHTCYGTAWRAGPSTIVTAGHFAAIIVGGKLHCLKSVEFIVGDHNTGDYEERHGTCVATPAAWIKDRASQHDVAVIELNEPFARVAPIAYKNTPSVGKGTIIVPGFPDDKGGKMHYSSQLLKWDLKSLACCSNTSLTPIMARRPITTAQYNSANDHWGTLAVHDS